MGLGGVTPDVLLSFGFLKHFNWTIDFDTHTWFFTELDPEHRPDVAGPDELERSVGSYAITIEIAAADGRLIFQVTGQQRVPLTWVEGHTFEIQGAGATVEFDEDSDGAVTGLALHQAGNTTRAKRSGDARVPQDP